MSRARSPIFGLPAERLVPYLKARISDPSELIDPEEPNDPPSLRITDSRVVESAGRASVRVLLSAPSRQAMQVRAFTRPATATPGVDFYGTSRLLSFAPGITQQTLPIVILDDAVSEREETIGVRLLNASNATITDGAATVTIEDDDDPAQPRVTISNQRIDEAAGRVDLVVNLSPPSNRVVTATVFTRRDGTATRDFYGATRQLRFEPGETSARFGISILDDSEREEDETFSLRFGAVNGAAKGNDFGTIAIVDDD